MIDLTKPLTLDIQFTPSPKMEEELRSAVRAAQVHEQERKHKSWLRRKKVKRKAQKESRRKNRRG